jgi:hypothetical protein
MSEPSAQEVIDLLLAAIGEPQMRDRPNDDGSHTWTLTFPPFEESAALQRAMEEHVVFDLDTFLAGAPIVERDPHRHTVNIGDAATPEEAVAMVVKALTDSGRIKPA